MHLHWETILYEIELKVNSEANLQTEKVASSISDHSVADALAKINL